jgi:hypothetical protein
MEVLMENNNIAPITEAAVIQKSSKAPIVITLVGMFLAGAITAAVMFFFFGGASSYERAERNALSSLFSGFSSVDWTATTASDSGSITITPSREIAALVPGLPDIGSLTFNYEAVVDGMDIYALLGAEVLGINASFAFWQIGEELIMHLPGISNYYILLSDMMGMNDLQSLDFLDADYEAMFEEIKKIGSAVLDRYFELTAGIESKWSEEVTVGELRRNAEVFEIAMDEAFLIEIAKAGLDAFLDSDTLMKFVRDLYNLENDPWVGRPWYRTFEQMLNELIDELYDADPFDFSDETLMTMRVYISGRDVVRRDIIIEDVTFSYSSITERNGQYARSARFSYTDWWGDTTTATLRDEGTTDNGYSTGQIRISVSGDYIDTVSFTIRYENFKIYDNGLFGGDIRINIPIDGVNIDVNLKASVTGDSVRATGSISALGMRILDLEINHSTNTGKRITRPALTNNNTLDINDWRAMEQFGEEVMNWAFSQMGGLDMDSLEDLFWDLGLYNIFGAFGGGYDYGWDDDYCYNCWNYGCLGNCEWCTNCWQADCWGGCLDSWCSGDEWCWCDDCYALRICSDCGNIHWDWDSDGEYTTYIINNNKGLWRVIIGGDWNETLWNAILADFGDCVLYVWSEWADAFAAYGFDYYDLFDEVTGIVYSVDWGEAMGTEAWLNSEYFYWSVPQWENFYRNILRAEGFAF